ncbi:MAG: alpha/beta hydrolase [Candidatus Azobacteroides sp.]|nr:alpha/beta hydrolase [Candidatus Azobacteroides sp.]
MDNEFSLKYPVVLVHGIIAYDRGRIMHFWGRIPEKLKENGVKVFFGNTDSWGDYESNAKILNATIEEVLDKTKSKKVNIIAHSKGGIDSRYFVWKYNNDDRIASLTTLSTPHRGAEIADLIYKQKIVHSDKTKKTLKIFGKLYGDINPDLYNVNYQLTTEKMREFNENIGMDQRVYYQSMYTTMKNSFDDLMFYYSHRYIQNISGDNDGIVSEHSAQWGKNIVKIEGGISHAEIIDRKRRKISGINIPDIYIKIVKDLSEKGF